MGLQLGIPILLCLIFKVTVLIMNLIWSSMWSCMNYVPHDLQSIAHWRTALAHAPFLLKISPAAPIV